MQLNCEKNIVKAFHVISQHANSNSCCDLAYSVLNNSNLTTRNANSLVTSDLPWHESRNKILTTVHNVIWPYEVKSQFPPQTLTQHPSATLIKTHSLKIQLINPANLVPRAFIYNSLVWILSIYWGKG